MSDLHPDTIGRKTGQQSDIPPILVSVRQARSLLANMCRDKIWQEIKRGALGEVVGTRQKRFLYFENVKRYADNLKRAPYSQKPELKESA